MSELPGSFRTQKTSGGLRLSQHGVVLSELRTAPGPTHSVFDVLAASVALSKPHGRVGVLGFAGGSIMAPLRALSAGARVEGVDLDRAGYDLFQEHCSNWAGELQWAQVDAVEWLRADRSGFDVLVDDLSIPRDGDVFKPEISWSVLPESIRDRLTPGGVAVLNQLKPDDESWSKALRRVAGLYHRAVVVDLDDFENRIVIAGAALPSARSLSLRLSRALEQIGSRQVGRFRLRTLR